jgi:hypothetical protein
MNIVYAYVCTYENARTHTCTHTRVPHTHNAMLSGLGGGMRTWHYAAHHRNHAILKP